MSCRIGINGFGRIGRLALRAGWDRSDLKFVHINEINGGTEAAAHLLVFDSVHGRWNFAVEPSDMALHVEGKSISFSAHEHPREIDWGSLGIDILLECTGKFREPDVLQAYFDAGVKKVIVAAPVKTQALNIVMGINDDLYDPDRHHLLTTASCTTNCLAPVVKVVHENLGVERGAITTIHDVTNTQVVVDAPHKDLRRARSALNSLIPTSTGSATAISLIYPELAGKLNGHAVRVPLLNASLTDCVFQVKCDTSAEEVNDLFKKAAASKLNGILAFEKLPLVSSDFVNNPHSAIIDGLSTMVVDSRMVKIYAWYDNEWGYVNRMIELAEKVASTFPVSV